MIMTLPGPLASPPIRYSNSVPTPRASQALYGPWTDPDRRMGDVARHDRIEYVDLTDNSYGTYTCTCMDRACVCVY